MFSTVPSQQNASKTLVHDDVRQPRFCFPLSTKGLSLSPRQTFSRNNALLLGHDEQKTDFAGSSVRSESRLSETA
jgi:hypothetical protein